MKNRPHVLIALIFIALIPMLLSLPIGCGSSGGDAATTTTSTTSTTISISNPTFREENVTTILVTYESGVSATQEVMNNQVVVTLASGQTQSDLETLLATEGGSIIGSNSYTGAYQISVPSGTSAQVFANTLDSSSVIDAAGTNPILYLELTPNDEYYNDSDYNWMFIAISAEAAWDLTTGETSVTIGMIDNGLYRGGTALSGTTRTNFQNEIDSSRLQFAAGSDRIDNDDDPTVDTENGYSSDNSDHHAIRVAGIIVAKGNNSNYMAGMNWNSWFYPFRASSGEADCQTYINALSTAIYNGVKVINCSTGSFLRPRFLVFANNQPHIDQFKALAALAESKNIMIVTSAGNTNNDGAGHYPSCLTADYDSVISVGGIDSSDARYYLTAAEGSNYGSTVDIAAPGESVYTLDNPKFTFTPVNGTSVAAPFVTGTISLMFSLADKHGYDLTVAEVKSILKSSSYTDSLSTDKSMGYKLNAYKALLGVCEKMSKAVVVISSNLSGAKVYFSSNGGSTYSDTGKTTNSQGIARIVVDSGTSLTYKFKLTKTGYSAATSSTLLRISAGDDYTMEVNFSSVSTTSTTSTTTTISANESATITASSNTYVLSSNNQVNSSGLNYDGQTYTWCGKFASDIIGLIKYDVSNIPSSSTIDSALMKFYVTNVTQSDPTVRFYNVDSSWDESTVTYNTRPSTTGAYVAQQTFTDADIGGWVSIDITEAVQAWVDGTTTNNGLAYISTNLSTSNVVYFKSDDSSSNKPYLEVEYY